MTEDRAAQLAAIADRFMITGRLPMWLPPGCTAVRAQLWPDAGRPYEVRFTATWPTITLVCSRTWPGPGGGEVGKCQDRTVLLHRDPRTGGGTD